MATPEHYDYVALGTGEAGKILAWQLSSQHGKKCAVIERQWLGGSCPNVACLPSKNLIHSASVVHDVRQAATYGLGQYINNADSLKVDLLAVKNRKVNMVDGLHEMLRGVYQDTQVKVIQGEGKFMGPKTIEVAGRLITGDSIVVNTGSTAFVDASIPGLVASKPLTHIEILNLEQLPSHLIIVGGGYVGTEFAQAFKRFGSEVTVLESREHLLPREDRDIINTLQEAIENEGVRFITSAKVERVTGISGESVAVTVTAGAETTTISGSHILVATGRVPNTKNIGLEVAGIELTDQGHIKVDKQLRTTADGVFALGDVAGGPYFTHVSFDHFRVILAYLTGSPRENGKSGVLLPFTLFTSPELAHVGLREHEAQARGIKYRLVKIPTASTLRARTLGDTRGFLKALVEADGEKILGFTALAPSAGELLPVVTLAIKFGVSYKEITNLPIAHPTSNEALLDLFYSL